MFSISDVSMCRSMKVVLKCMCCKRSHRHRLSPAVHVDACARFDRGESEAAGRTELKKGSVMVFDFGEIACIVVGVVVVDAGSFPRCLAVRKRANIARDAILPNPLFTLPFACRLPPIHTLAFGRERGEIALKIEILPHEIATFRGDARPRRHCQA